MKPPCSFQITGGACCRQSRCNGNGCLCLGIDREWVLGVRGCGRAITRRFWFLLVKVLSSVWAHAELIEFNNTDQAPAELIEY